MKIVQCESERDNHYVAKHSKSTCELKKNGKKL